MFPQLCVLPEIPAEITFITTQELEDLYPDLTPKQREHAFVKDHPVTFLMGIGGKLKSGKPHDGRAPALRRLEPERRPAVLGQRQRPVPGDLLHGHPGQPRVPGPPAHLGRLR